MNQKFSLLFILLAAFVVAGAQENSPFSRYGLGDPYPGGNIINRAFGGITSVYANPQSINFSNPASYSVFNIVTYDIGLTLDSRTLKSASPVEKYNSVNLTPSYVALGMPLNKKRNLGLAFGLRPLTKVSYNITDSRRINGNRDSVHYIYEGDGGLYQAFVGVGKRWKGLSIGVNTGVMFGRKENTTRTLIIDSVITYNSNSSTSTTFNSTFLNFGLQYVDTIKSDITKNSTTTIHFGAAGNFKQSLNARQTILRETFSYDVNGTPQKIDSIYTSKEAEGKIVLPFSYTAGFSINKSVYGIEKAMLAVEYESTQWSQFRIYDQTDKLVNSWLFKVGGQLIPNPLTTKSYWNRVTYRAGFYFGKDAVNADGNTLPVTAITFGAGLPIRRYRAYDNQWTNINTTFEIGKRGNKSNNITESFFRFSIGLNLSDVWFIKRRYD